MSGLDLLAVALASLVGAFVKSVTGMGYPLIAIPVLTVFIGVEAAVAVIAIPNAVLNGLLSFGARAERRHARDLPVLLATGLVGGVLGTLVLVEAPERPLLIGLALTIAVFLAQRLRQPELALRPETTRRWAPLVGTLVGFSHGAVGVSGPLVALWFHGYRLPRDAYVFSVTAVFLVGGLAQLVVLVAADALGRERLLASGVALAATLAMLPLGTRVRGRLESGTFERLILALLVVSGGALLWRAFGGRG